MLRRLLHDKVGRQSGRKHDFVHGDTPLVNKTSGRLGPYRRAVPAERRCQILRGVWKRGGGDPPERSSDAGAAVRVHPGLSMLTVMAAISGWLAAASMAPRVAGRRLPV